ETMNAQQVWGFSPRESWTSLQIGSPVYEKGKLRLLGEYEPGLTWRIDKKDIWKSFFDKRTGWYCIGDYNIKEDDFGVEFANNRVVIMNDYQLKSICIKQTFK